MYTANKYFEILAHIELYESSKGGRKSVILDGYRPHIYFGYSNPINPNFASDCIVHLIDRIELFPGQGANVNILVLKYKHLEGLMTENVKLKIKEGSKFIGEGFIIDPVGEKCKQVELAK